MIPVWALISNTIQGLRPAAVFLALLVAASIAVTASAQEAAVPVDDAEDCFALARRLAEADDGGLWGRSLAGPLLLVDPATREVVANQADGEGRLIQQGAIWTGQLPGEVQPSNTSLEWAGIRWTMVMRSSIANSPYERGRLLMHESFHRIQPELGLAAESPTNAHLDKEDGRTWLRLEIRALAEAMVQSDERRRAAAQDALLFRAVRHGLVGTAAVVEELALETNEGLAEYTGLRLSGMPEATQEQRLAVDLERAEAASQLTRSFAYVTGPAWGMLLDEVRPGWRRDVRTESRLAWLYAESTAFTAPESAESLQAAGLVAAKRYGGQTVLREESVRAQRRAARLAELERLFAPDVSLRISTGPQFRYSFDPNQAEPLDGQRVFYRPFSASDEWGCLEAPEGAVVDFAAPMAVLLPIPAGATPDSVPWRLELKSPFRLDAPIHESWSVKNDQ